MAHCHECNEFDQRTIFRCEKCTSKWWKEALMKNNEKALEAFKALEALNAIKRLPTAHDLNKTIGQEYPMGFEIIEAILAALQSPLPDLAGLKKRVPQRDGTRDQDGLIHGRKQWNAAIDACIAALANRADKKGGV